MIQSTVGNAHLKRTYLGFGAYVTLRNISISSRRQNMDTATFRKAAHAAIDESNIFPDLGL